MTSNGIHGVFRIKPNNATPYEAATTARTTVPVIKAASAPAVTPMYPVFNDRARDSGLTHQKTMLPMSPIMFNVINNARIFPTSPNSIFFKLMKNIILRSKYLMLFSPFLVNYFAVKCFFRESLIKQMMCIVSALKSSGSIVRSSICGCRPQDPGPNPGLSATSLNSKIFSNFFCRLFA